MRTNTTTQQSKQAYMVSVVFSLVPVLIIFIAHALYMTLGGGSYHFLAYSCLIGTVNWFAYATLKSAVYTPVYWRSTLLTNTFLVGLMLVTSSTSDAGSLSALGFYLMALSFFHISEFVFTCAFNEREATTDSFLLNHSWEYGVAALASWLEFALEAWLWPSLKSSGRVRWAGLALVVFGECFRKLAMYTAGTNFNHYVQERKQQGHELVTRGVYRLVRHPSYFGWFYWSIGTQIVLANPVCVVLYTLASWQFFNTRIAFEEYHLVKFFGKQYLAYQKSTPIGIPGIRGFRFVEESLD